MFDSFIERLHTRLVVTMLFAWELRHLWLSTVLACNSIIDGRDNFLRVSRSGLDHRNSPHFTQWSTLVEYTAQDALNDRWEL